MPCSKICRVLVVGGDPKESDWAAYWQDVIGGLGKGDWHLLGCWVEGLWHCVDLSLPIEWECHLLDPNHPVKGSSIGCLANSIPWGPAKGEWAHEVEQLWEHLLLLKVGLASPGLLCRPALAIHLASSWCSSWIHSSCHQWRSTLGATMHSPRRLAWLSLLSLCLWTLKGPKWRGVQGPLFQPSLLAVLGSTFSVLFSSWRLHCGAGTLSERDPIPVCRWYSSPGVLILAHWEKVDPWGSSQQLCWNGWSSGQIPLPTPQIWWNSHTGEWLILPSWNRWWAF